LHAFLLTALGLDYAPGSASLPVELMFTKHGRVNSALE